MEAFERATGLHPDEYWIEATAGGAAAFEGVTTTAQFAFDQGARLMGWAGHGDTCGGFPDRSNEEMKEKVRDAGAARARDFPEARHWSLFGEGGTVGVARLD